MFNYTEITGMCSLGNKSTWAKVKKKDQDTFVNFDIFQNTIFVQFILIPKAKQKTYN